MKFYLVYSIPIMTNLNIEDIKDVFKTENIKKIDKYIYEKILKEYEIYSNKIDNIINK